MKKIIFVFAIPLLSTLIIATGFYCGSGLDMCFFWDPGFGFLLFVLPGLFFFSIFWMIMTTLALKVKPVQTQDNKLGTENTHKKNDWSGADSFLCFTAVYFIFFWYAPNFLNFPSNMTILAALLALPLALGFAAISNYIFRQVGKKK